MVAWRVEAGALIQGDHYVVGHSGIWYLARNTQEAHALCDELNSLEARLAVAEAALSEARKALTITTEALNRIAPFADYAVARQIALKALNALAALSAAVPKEARERANSFNPGGGGRVGTW